MEINRFFNELPIRILGTHEEPAFYANEIAKILDIKSVRRFIMGFSPKEIVQHNDRERLGIRTYRIYKNRPVREDPNMILLTIRGVYRMLLYSRTQIADQFRNWVFDVLDELRTQGKYEIQVEMQRLKTISEAQLAKINQLSSMINDLEARQNRFKQMTEKIYIIELKNDISLVEQRHVPKDELGEDYETDDDEISDTESDPEDDYITRRLKLIKRADPGYRNRVMNAEQYYNLYPDFRPPEFTYKVAKEYTELDKIKGTVRYEAFVRNANETIDKLDSQLEVHRLKSVDKVHYYNCDLGEILDAANMVILGIE